MKFGGYAINVMTTSFPQNVISGFDKAFEGMTGAQYNMIAYLGSKVVNGTNHIYLAEQTLVTGKDVKSIVTVILNEKLDDVGGNTFSVVSIEPLVSNGGNMGGLNINPTTNIPEDAMTTFNKHFAGFVGAYVKPFALLATQVVKGVAYLFAVESTMIVTPSKLQTYPKSVQLVKVYTDFSEVEFTDVVTGEAAPALKADYPYVGKETNTPSWP